MFPATTTTQTIYLHRTTTLLPRSTRAFAGLSVWNSLPDPVRNPNSTKAALRRLQKTFLLARH